MEIDHANYQNSDDDRKLIDLLEVFKKDTTEYVIGRTEYLDQHL